MSIHARIHHRAFQGPEQEAVVSLLVAAGHVLQRINGLLREHGITHDQYNVLRILRGADPEGHTVADVGKRMISRAPDVTRLLDRLERRALITRAWAPENRRFTIARIAPAGRELMAAVDPALHALQQELMRGASPEELDVLTRVCSRIVG